MSFPTRLAPLTSIVVLAWSPVAGAGSLSVAAADPAGRIAIAHDAVGCVLADRHPRISACVTPPENLGRAQVLFRVDESSAWYSVALQPDAGCLSALLPKPLPTISGFQYFIEALDRSFAVVEMPEDAVDRPYSPRVVSTEAACEAGRLAAAGAPSGSVVVSLARDVGGRVLQAAAAQGVGSGGIAGFSLEGVAIAGPRPATAGSGSSSGGLSAKTLAIGGGLAAAGAAVAVAGGGGGGATGKSGSGGGATAPGGGSSSSGSSGTGLTGRWTGLAANGDGLRLTLSEQGITCNYAWDFILDLSQSGSTLGGNFDAPFRTLSCSVPLPIPEWNEGGDAGPLSGGNVSGTAVRFQIGPMTFEGNVAGSVIEGTATHPEGPGLVWTWRVRR
jgi:hypothetical protein